MESGEPKGVRIGDVHLVPIHDATLRSLAIVWSDDGDFADLVLHCDLHEDEDPTPLGINAHAVEVVFHDIDDTTIIQRMTGERSYIDRWNTEGSYRHRITTHSGAEYDIICADVWIVEREER